MGPHATKRKIELLRINFENVLATLTVETDFAKQTNFQTGPIPGEGFCKMGLVKLKMLGPTENCSMVNLNMVCEMLLFFFFWGGGFWGFVCNVGWCF